MCNVKCCINESSSQSEPTFLYSADTVYPRTAETLGTDTCHHRAQLYGWGLSGCGERDGRFHTIVARGHHDGRLCLVGGDGAVLCHHVPFEMGSPSEDSLGKLYLGLNRGQPHLYAYGKCTGIGGSQSGGWFLPHVGHL